jgi:hypothetical protein
MLLTPHLTDSQFSLNRHGISGFFFFGIEFTILSHYNLKNKYNKWKVHKNLSIYEDNYDSIFCLKIKKIKYCLFLDLWKDIFININHAENIL